MTPPVFEVCAADSGVTSLLGTSPTRLFPFGQAPQGVALPYAVHQVITGFPENYLGQVPDIDSFTVQIDVYAESVSEARQVAEALRDAIEPHAHITGWNGESTDQDTSHKRYGFDVDWYVQR